MNFEWQQALLGGVIIGLSVALLKIVLNRVAGISGIFAVTINAKKENQTEFSWSLSFIIGLMISGLIYRQYADIQDISINNNTAVIILAGVLVGMGTRLANGCTSGHGIVGMGRFSKRSIVATCTFMIVAIAVVFVRRNLGVL